MAAEQLLGERDKTKTIYQPSFHNQGPHIRNTPTLDGAFVELSNSSKVYWPTVVYEMAHETVHLLNPTVGNTNWLEEGVAVEFSIHAQKLYVVPVQAPTSGPYLEALQMVRLLPGGVFAAAHAVRKMTGALSAISVEHLSDLFPSVATSDLRRLSDKCVPR